jgi:hypothetical protein
MMHHALRPTLSSRRKGMRRIHPPHTSKGFHQGLDRFKTSQYATGIVAPTLRNEECPRTRRQAKDCRPGRRGHGRGPGRTEAQS